MDLKLPTLPSFARRTRRDPGISLNRANHHWFLALMAGIVLTILAGGIAYYEFLMMQQDELILTDPVHTARYRADDVKAALELYDARRASYKIGEPVPIRNNAQSGENAGSVATPSTIRVE